MISHERYVLVDLLICAAIAFAGVRRRVHNREGALMPVITVTAECEQLIRANANAPFCSNATKLPNGDYQIPIEYDTLKRLDQVKFPDESYSDAIIRGLNIMRSGRN